MPGALSHGDCAKKNGTAHAAGWVAIGALGLLLLFRRLWLRLIGKCLIVADPLSSANAVVPLAGGGLERVGNAVSLFQGGYADWFLATNPPLSIPGVQRPYGDLVRGEAISRGVPATRVLVISTKVETTLEEAIAIRQLIRERGWRSLIVVTDPFHTRRARLIFRQVFRGTGVDIVFRPANGHWYRANAWWQSPRGLRETALEYLKLLAHVLGYH